MKKLFRAIGMAALMLVAGTNVWMANSNNKVESALTLSNVEAEGIPFNLAEAYYLSKKMKDGTHWEPNGNSYVGYAIQNGQRYKLVIQPRICKPEGTSDCIINATEDVVISKEKSN